MRILHGQDERLQLTGVATDLVQDTKSPSSAFLWAAVRQTCVVHRDTQELEQERRGLRMVEPRFMESPVHGGCHYLGTVHIAESPVLPEHIPYREIRRRPAIGQAMPFVVRHALPCQALSELCQQARLPHARVADNTDHLPLAVRRLGQASLE
jgi:hypothetical protein